MPVSFETIVSRPVSVKIDALTKDDCELMEKEQLINVIGGLMGLLQSERHTKVTQEAEVVLESPATAPQREEPSLFTPTVATGEKRVHKGGSHDGALGFKYGVTSKFHYVSFNKKKKNNPWNASIKSKENNYSQYFATEIQAALAADRFNSGVKDNKRPLNRIEHPEVAQAYFEENQKQQEVK